MNERQKTQRAVWRRLRAGWPRGRTTASDSFVQAVMDKVRREPVPGPGTFRLRDRLFGPAAGWSLAAAAALALALVFVRPASPPAVSLAGLGGEQALLWEEESAGYGTNVEKYLL